MPDMKCFASVIYATIGVTVDADDNVAEK